MGSHDIDDSLREAGEPDQAAVDRVVRRALTGTGRGALRWTYPVAVLAVGAAVVAAVGVWRHARPAGPEPAGVFRVTANPSVPSTAVDRMPSTRSHDGTGAAPFSASPDGLDGVYRAEATRSPVLSRVIRVTTDDGTTWILSLEADDALPAGTAIIVGGGDGR